MIRLFFITLILFLGGVALIAKLSAAVEKDQLAIWAALAIGAVVVVSVLSIFGFIFAKTEGIRYDLKAARQSGEVPFYLLVGGWFVGNGERNYGENGPVISDGWDGGGIDAGDGGGGD